MLLVERLVDHLTRALLVLAAILAFLLCFLVTADVIGRVAFNRPVKGTTEIVSLTIVIVCYLQAGFAIRSGGMLNVEMFVSRGGPRTRAFFAAISALAGLVFFGLIFWASFEGAAHAWTSNEFEGEGALRVPVWPARFIIILGTFIAALSYLLLLLRAGMHVVRGTPPAPIGVSH